MKTLLIIAMTQLQRDVRVLRHIAALKDQYRIVTVGFGVAPLGTSEHVRIPDKCNYLPTNIAALVPHICRMYGISSQKTKAIHHVTKILKDLDYDLVVLNDVQTLPLIEDINKPIIVDMHEYAPREMDDDWRFRVFLMSYYYWLCKKYLPKANKVMTVSSGLAKEYQAVFGVTVEVLLNAREFVNLPVRETVGNYRRIVHTGLAAKSRHLEIMIEAVSGLPKVFLDMYLVPAPRQSRELRRLQLLASRTSNVRVIEPVIPEELPAVINLYDLALIYLAPNSFSVKHCMPNKLFDCIQARVGVVASPLPDVAEFVKREQIGRTTKSFTSQALQNEILQLSNYHINQFKYSCNKVANEINAGSEAKTLQQLVSDTLSANRG